MYNNKKVQVARPNVKSYVFKGKSHISSFLLISFSLHF